MRKAILEKQGKIQELSDLMSRYRTVMIATMEGVPAPMMQEIRRRLRGRAVVRVYKNVIILRALESQTDETLKLLAPYVEGHPTTIVLSNEDPVKLYKEITSVESFAPLKAGKPSPVDVVLKPGPVPVPITALSEVKAAGIPVKSVKGSVQLEEEFIAVRTGEIVDEKLARALELMGVKPVKIYLRVIAATSDGVLYTEDVLDITKEDVESWLRDASRQAFNLSYNSGYPTPQTLPLFLADAHRKALNLAVNAGVITKGTVSTILAKARATALALASRLPPEALDEKTRERLGSMATQVQKQPEEEPQESQEEKDEAGKEDATTGLASLFG